MQSDGGKRSSAAVQCEECADVMWFDNAARLDNSSPLPFPNSDLFELNDSPDLRDDEATPTQEPTDPQNSPVQSLYKKPKKFCFEPTVGPARKKPRMNFEEFEKQKANILLQKGPEAKKSKENTNLGHRFMHQKHGEGFRTLAQVGDRIVNQLEMDPGLPNRNPEWKELFDVVKGFFPMHYGQDKDLVALATGGV